MLARPGAPCLRPDIAIIEQTFRGETSFVVKDLAGGKYFRFGALEVRVMRAFDGQRTATEIAEALGAEGMRVSPATVEAFARTLADAGFLERALGERTTLQMERLRAERRERRRPRLFRGELLRMRWSFGDPDVLLTRSMPYLEWMFTRAFVVGSVAVFALYFVLLAARWDEFRATLAATYSLHALTLANVFVLWLTGAVVILVHELGHGYACKHYGGDVRELGFMLIYFQPAFYCNVSDAWSFPERRARLWVTAAGGWIQLVVASVAAIVWWAAAPDTLVARVAVAAMLVGGATTLLTNANPLLPLDGYFALTDWLEIPNLRLRAIAHFRWWMRRTVLRLEEPEPDASPRERRVFLVYGGLAALYAIGLFAFLASLLLGWARTAFGVAGAILVTATLVLLLHRRLVALWRALVLVVRSRRDTLRRVRRPAGLAAALLLLALVFVPWTLTSPGDFVVAPLAARTITAADSGVVDQLFVLEGMRVAPGTPVLRIVNRELERRVIDASGVVDSLALAESAARSSGRAGDASRLEAERTEALAALAALARRVDALTLRATGLGVVTTPHPEELLGRRVAAGDTLLLLASPDSVEVRIALAGGGATRVRAGQVVHLVSLTDVGAPVTSRVYSVSSVGIAPGVGQGVVEARVRRAATDAWRAGASGEASVELARSNLLGALWWNARQLVRVDLLL
jgi:hypothetical protein